MKTSRPHWRMVPAQVSAPDVCAAHAPSWFDDLDCSGFAASLSQLLARGAGRQIMASTPRRPDGSHNMAAGPWWQVARFTTAAGTPLLLCAAPVLVAALAEALFGGTAQGAEPQALEGLPPGNVGWAVVAGMLTTGCVRALAASNRPLADDTAVVATRAAPVSGALDGVLLQVPVAIEGVTGDLLLVDSAACDREPAVTDLPDPEMWRREVRGRTLAIDFPVALHLDEITMSLTAVSALKVGDIIPIDRPRRFSVMVAGRRIGSVAANRIAGQAEAGAYPDPSVPAERWSLDEGPLS